MVRRKRINKAKLHRQLADTENLRIYRVVYHQSTKCVICATALVDPSTGLHLKENPTLTERMDNPWGTNGTRMTQQFWLQEGGSGPLIGPCGENCGGRAVLGSWMKEKRDQMRQELLASGVPKDEIEDRLEQFAWKEWRKMLSVYRKAEREGKKLGIDTNSLTYDEICAAIDWEKGRQRFNELVEKATSMGLPTDCKGTNPLPIPGGIWVGAPKGGSPEVAWEVGGVVCTTAAQVQTVIENYTAKQHAAQVAAAQVSRNANRQRYNEYVVFIEWALETGGNPGSPNFNTLSAAYRDRQTLEYGLQYIDQGSPFQSTLKKIEEVAIKARSWPDPWLPNWPVGAQPVQPTGAVPVCPNCGGKLLRKQGTSKYGRHKQYDFMGCEHFPRCRGTMEVVEYDAQMAGVPSQNLPAPTVTPPVTVAPVKSDPKELAKQRKRKAFWS